VNVISRGCGRAEQPFASCCTAIGGKQLFRQYDVFNQHVFLKYLKELQRKFRKLLLFIDRAVQYRSSIMVRRHLEENKDIIRVEYLPRGRHNQVSV
jgi:hypothetical protein